jgi:hypothetical protein
MAAKPQEKQIAPNALLARNIRGAMKKQGRVKDLRTRERLARNLGSILAKWKSTLNMSDLVAKAGISSTNDPNRLGRFRILPDRVSSVKAVERLSQNLHAYLGLLDAICREVEEDSDSLLLELVLGTKFDGADVRQLSIEPFEQLLGLIQTKIETLDTKYNLSEYFKKIHEHQLVPRWEDGPLCSGRRTSHHAYERSKILSWDAVKSSDFDEWRKQSMPCVPLCRTRSLQGSSENAKIVIDGKEYECTLELYNRLYLAIGMFSDRYRVQDDDFNHEKVVTDPKPRLYLIAAKELFAEHFMALMHGHRPFRLSGTVFELDVPGFLYDTERGIQIEEMEGRILYIGENVTSLAPREFGCWEPSELAAYQRLDLPQFRGTFGKKREEFEIESSADDQLDIRRRQMTLAPQETIASFMEANLLPSSTAENDQSQNTSSHFLDALEEDVKRLTSNFQSWFDSSQEILKQQHIALLAEFDSDLDTHRGQK